MMQARLYVKHIKTETDMTDSELQELATDILAGKTLPFGPHGVYDSADWIDGAEQAHEGELTDLRIMVAKERAWGRFTSSHLASRNDWTFEEYYERMAA